MPAETLTVTFPLPPRVLSPNARPHWAVKHKAVKAYREGAAWLVKAAMKRAGIKGGWTRATAQATFYWPRNGHDADNCAAMLKSAWDGMADAGLFTNDRHLTPHAPVLDTDKTNPRVVIVLEGERE